MQTFYTYIMKCQNAAFKNMNNKKNCNVNQTLYIRAFCLM